MSEHVFLQAITTLMATIAFVAALPFARRFLELRHERRTPIALEGMLERLDRIESGIDAMAVEFERLSEANRFMAKLLSERVGADALPPLPVEAGNRDRK